MNSNQLPNESNTTEQKPEGQPKSQQQMLSTQANPALVAQSRSEFNRVPSDTQALHARRNTKDTETRKAEKNSAIIKIADEYISIANMYGLDMRCDVLAGYFEDDPLKESNFIVRTLWKEQGYVRASYPLANSIFSDSFEGIAFHLNKQKKNKVIQDSTTFLFSLIKNTLYFIESNINKTEQGRQYYIVSLFCLHVREIMPHITPVGLAGDVQSNLLKIEKKLKITIEKIAKSNENLAITNGIAAMEEDASIIYKSLKETLLHYIFDKEIPPNLYGDNKFSDHSLEYKHFVSDENPNAAIHGIIDTKDKFDLMHRVICSADVSKLRKDGREAAILVHKSRLSCSPQIEYNTGDELALFSSVRNITASNQDVNRLDSDKKIIATTDKYDEELTKVKDFTSKLVQSKGLSVLFDEMYRMFHGDNISPNNKDTIVQFQNNLFLALMRVVELKALLDLIRDTKEYADAGGVFASFFGFELLHGVALNALEQFAQADFLVNILQVQSAEIQGMSHTLSKPTQWNNNFNHAHRITHDIGVRIDESAKHIGSFLQAITREKLIKNLRRMDELASCIYVQLKMAKKCVEYPATAHLTGMLADTLEQRSLTNTNPQSKVLLQSTAENNDSVTIEDVTDKSQPIYPEQQKKPNQPLVSKKTEIVSNDKLIKLDRCDFLNLALQHRTQKNEKVTITQLLDAEISTDKKQYHAKNLNKLPIGIDSGLYQLIEKMMQTKYFKASGKKILNVKSTLPKNVISYQTSDLLGATMKLGSTEICFAAVLAARSGPIEVGKSDYCEATIDINNRDQIILIEKDLKELLEVVRDALKMPEPVSSMRPDEDKPVINITPTREFINKQKENEKIPEIQPTLTKQKSDEVKQERNDKDVKQKEDDIIAKLQDRFGDEVLKPLLEAREKMQQDDSTSYQEEIKKLLATLDRRNDVSYQLLSFKPWWLLLWLTGVGAVVHGILAIGAKIYRVFNQENIQRDERLYERLNAYNNGLVLEKLPIEPDKSNPLPQPGQNESLSFNKNKRSALPSQDGLFAPGMATPHPDPLPQSLSFQKN